MVFRRALIRLTVTYTIVQLLLFGAFALGVYSFVTGAFDFDVGEQDGQSSFDVEKSFADLRSGLISGYSILIIVLPASSYLMARAALAPVRRSYELQQRFVDGASHELRSPLSVIQGELELALSRSRTQAQYRAAITRSLDAVQGLTQLTNDLLLLARESTHELEATFQPVSLNEVARNAAGTDPQRVTVLEASTAIVLGSPELLARAVGNLIDNALKFSAEASPIEISVAAGGGTARISVSDHGIGMTETESAHAFDRFWRAQDARSMPGFGLGLPLVGQIVEAHRGTVSIASSPGVGTTVTLTIPEYQP